MTLLQINMALLGIIVCLIFIGIIIFLLKALFKLIFD